MEVIWGPTDKRSSEGALLTVLPIREVNRNRDMQGASWWLHLDLN